MNANHVMPVRRAAIALVLIWAVVTSAAPPSEWTLKTKVRGRWLEGMPLAWNQNEIHLLGRDGRLSSFLIHEASESQKTASYFQGYTPAQLRARLMREFGKNFDVSGAGQYLVVHPTGQRDQWAGRFEELYHSFRHYFSVRGFRLSKPKFPLVAVVFQTQGEMARYARSEGTKIGRNVLGYYSPVTNRVAMYDSGQGRATQGHWAENWATIVHEATHQTAYNCGIHSRVATTPSWIAEGLGTMFEARGVWDSRRYPRLADRLNWGRLRDFRRRVAGQFNGGALADFVASDRAFRADRTAAYATAWTLTFYLVEMHPRQYTKYLARVAARPALSDYRDGQRTADFTAAFGRNFAMHSAKLLRFVADLK